MLPGDVLERSYDELEAGFDAVFSIGTTSVFPYIAGPIELARRCGWATIEINPVYSDNYFSSLTTIRIPG